MSIELKVCAELICTRNSVRAHVNLFDFDILTNSHYKEI